MSRLRPHEILTFYGTQFTKSLALGHAMEVLSVTPIPEQ